MQKRPTYTITFYSGGHVDPTYKKLTDVDNIGDVLTYMTESSIVVPNKPIRAEIGNFEDSDSFYNLYSANYLKIKGDDNKTLYYGFIKNVEYVNDGTANITWSVDYWATYKDKLSLSKRQFINRAYFMTKGQLSDALQTTDEELPTGENKQLIASDTCANEISGDDILKHISIDEANNGNGDEGVIPFISPLGAPAVHGDSNDDPHNLYTLEGGYVAPYIGVPSYAYDYHNGHFSDDDGNGWYVLYVMPESNIKTSGVTSNGVNTKDISKKTNITLHYLTDKPKAAKITYKSALIPDSTNAINNFSVTNSNNIDSNSIDSNNIDFGSVDIYLSHKLSSFLQLNLVGCEGYKIIGCEYRQYINSVYIFSTKIADDLYEYGGPLYYEGDNYANVEEDEDHENSDYTYDNGKKIPIVLEAETPDIQGLFDKNLYSEEIVVNNQKLTPDISQNLGHAIGYHIFDSILPKFSPFYSFYNINSTSAYSKPNAGNANNSLYVNIDRSIPIYADKSYGYYLSHLNRINAEINNKLLGIDNVARKDTVTFNGNLEKIANNYNVSLQNLYNSLVMNKATANNNAGNNQTSLGNKTDNDKSNANKNNGIDQTLLSNTQSVNVQNTKNSQTTAKGNLGRSTQTAYDNTAASANVSVSNTTNSANNAVQNTASSQALAKSNLINSQQASKANNAHSADLSYYNTRRSANLSVTNTENSTQVQQANLKRSHIAANNNLKSSNDTAYNNIDTNYNSNQIKAKASNKLSISNTDKNTSTQNSAADKRLKTAMDIHALAKVTSIVGGLDFSDGLKALLGGLLSSSLLGFLDVASADAASTMQTNTTKDINNLNNDNQNSILADTLSTQLANLKTGYDASKETTQATQNTSETNLKRSHGAENRNLSASVQNAINNAKRSAHISKYNAKLGASLSKANLVRSQEAQLNNMEASNANANAIARRNASVSKSNAENSASVSKSNTSRTNATSKSNLYDTQCTVLGNLISSNNVAMHNLKESIKKEINNIDLSYTNGTIDINTSLENAIRSYDNSNTASINSLENDTSKAYAEAYINLYVQTECQIADEILDIQSFINNFTAQVEDWRRSNWTQLTDGQGLAVKCWKLSVPTINIYEVMPNVENQIYSYRLNYGLKLMEYASIKTMLNPNELKNYESEFYTINGLIHIGNGDDDNIFPNTAYQYIQTKKCILYGNAPTEAITTLENAFNNGVFIRIYDETGTTKGRWTGPQYNYKYIEGDDYYYDGGDMKINYGDLSGKVAEINGKKDKN